MANTYTQLLVQIVFAVKGRHSVITETHREQVEKYICGVIGGKQSKPLAIYCNPDHCHVLIGINTSTSISELVRVIKSNSSKYINENKWMVGNFEWQEGYGAFSYIRSQLDSVVNYILNQPERHRKSTFRQEYLQLLREFEISFEEKYVFDFLD